MIREIIKKIIKFCLYSVLVLSTCLLFLTLWIYTGPKSLPFLANYIENQLKSVLPENINLYISDVVIAFDKGSHIAIKLSELKLEDTNRGSLELNEVKLRFDFLSLLPQSNRNFINIQIAYPKIDFKKNSAFNSSQQLLFEKINKSIQEHKSRIKSFSISLENTSLSFTGFNERNVDMIINTLSLKPTIHNNNLVFVIYGDLSLGGKNNILDLTLDTTSNQYLSIKGYVNNISVSTLKATGLDFPELKHASIETDIAFTALLKSTRNIDYVEFELSNFEGILKKNSFFAHDLKPDKALIKGYCHNNCSEIEFEQIKIMADPLNFEGQFNVRAINGHPTLAGKFIIKELPVNEVQNYWPTPITPRTRDWIFTHISDGMLKSATGIINLNLDNIKQKKRLQKDDVNITLKLTESSIFYMNGAPKIKNVDATLTITGEDISFLIKKAKVLESSISNVTGYIPNLGTRKSRVDVNCHLSGSIQDLIDLSFAHADIKNNEFLNFKGSANTDVKVSVPLNDEDITLDNLNLEVHSTISDVEARNVYKDFNIYGGSFKAEYKNKVGIITGTTFLNDKVPLTVQLTQNFSSFERLTKINAKMNWDDLPLIGINKPSYFNNFFNAEIEIKTTKNLEKKSINLDITPSTLWVSYLGLGKKIGDSGTIKLELTDEKKQNLATNYKIKIGTFESIGTGHITNDFAEIINITSPSTKLNRSNFAFTYKKAKDTSIINITGESLDLSELSYKNLSLKKSNQRQEGPITENNLSIFTKLKKIHLKNNIVLTNPSLEVTCNKIRCEKIKLKGMADNKTEVKLDYNYPVFSIASNDAGTTLRSLDITDKIQGGTLNFHGKYINNKLKGELTIEEYQAKKFPVLAKVLSLASITVASFEGAANILGNQGIKFEKLSCPFTYHDGITTLEDCKSIGKTLAITASGELNFDKNAIKVSGTVIPENILNKAINNIPIIGNFFGSNNAFIGVNYNIEGQIDDPKVYTNPLSMLTPGFLRQIFNIGK